MLYPLWSCSLLFAGAQLHAVTLRRESHSELLCGRKQDIILEMKSTVLNIISQRKRPHDLPTVLLFHFADLISSQKRSLCLNFTELLHNVLLLPTETTTGITMMTSPSGLLECAGTGNGFHFWCIFLGRYLILHFVAVK